MKMKVNKLASKLLSNGNVMRMSYRVNSVVPSLVPLKLRYVTDLCVITDTFFKKFLIKFLFAEIRIIQSYPF